TAAWNGASGKPRTGRNGRRATASPTPASSSAVAPTGARATAAGSCPPAPQAPRTPTSPPAQTTTFRSRRNVGTKERAARQEATGADDGRPAQVLLFLQDPRRRGRLQGGRRATALHLREGEDPFAAHHGRLPPPPAPG